MNTITIPLKGRIDANNAPNTEAQIAEVLAKNPELTPTFDASELEYISSAGLRVLLKFRKQFGKNLDVLNASQEVFDIFEVTGFNQLFNVNKRIREISVEGCEFVGSGGYGKVHRLDAETIVKLYNPGISLEFVQQERNTSQKAFLMGVPTAISYDVVKCGNSFGVVYEMLNAKTTAQIIRSNPERIPEISGKSAQLLRKLHNITPPENSGLPDRKQGLLELFGRFSSMFTPEERDKVIRVINSIPDRNTFLHGDYNAKNIMVNNGDFQLIDIGDAAIGHPVFDVIGLMLVYIILPASKKSRFTDEERLGLLGFGFEYAPQVWNVMCSTYFGLTSQAQVDAMTQKLMPYCRLMASIHGFRLYSSDNSNIEPLVKYFREGTMPILENAQPIDF